MLKNQLETSMSTFKTTISGCLFALLLGSSFGSNVYAQSVNMGADLVNRYVWRGTDFGQSLSIQPELSYSANGFTVGSWGSFAVSPQSAGANEHDLFASYAIETGQGTLSIGVTDYYFPNGANPDFFDYDGTTGAHELEPNVSYTGPDGAPVTVYAAVNAHLDPQNSVWLEVSYPFSVESVDFSLAFGGTPSESSYYGTDGAGILKMSLAASKRIPITDVFSLPVNVSYYMNPYAGQTFFLFGVHL